jgi:eukaryotic-like serine/threonine-protein kinase
MLASKACNMLKQDDIIEAKYRIVRLIGEGGMGAVYEGRHTGTGRRVAIKVIRPSVKGDGTDVLMQRFQREAQAAGAIESQYIAQVFDAGKESRSGSPYLVLEYLTGEDVQQLLRRLGPLPVELALRIVAQTCSGLSKAHAANVVHRDIKPANIFLAKRDDGDIVCKLLDFGVAKFTVDQTNAELPPDSTDQAGLTQTGALLGSPLFMSPEQARGRRDIDYRADIWSLGITLYKMLIGKTPHERPGLGIGDLIMAICLEAPAPIRQIAPWVPEQVEALLLRLLRVDREERYQSADEVLADVRPLLGGNVALHESMLVARDPEQPVQLSVPPVSSASGNPPLGQLLNSPPAPSSTKNEVSLAGPPSESKSRVEPPTASTLNPAIHITAPATVPTLPNPQFSLASPPSPRNRLPVLGGVGVLVLAVAFVTYNRFTSRPIDASNTTSATTAAPSIPSATPAAALPTASATEARPAGCPEGMVLVPGGRFYMGSDEANFKLWQPAHPVILDTFCIDAHEVTAAEYKACSDQGDCKRPPEVPSWPKTAGTSDAEHDKKRTAYAELCNFGKADRGNHPINCVDWSHADRYCTSRSKRLPTEAEWEFAARGSDGRKFPWGDDEGTAKHMNAGGLEFTRWEKKHALAPSTRLYEIDDGFEGTAPVGSFPKGKTKFGADDFVGNVWEWTADWFEIYKPDETVNPKGAPMGDRKAIRGGGFNGGMMQWLNPAFRFHQTPDAATPVIGFRCVTNLRG